MDRTAENVDISAFLLPVKAVWRGLCIHLFTAVVSAFHLMSQYAVHVSCDGATFSRCAIRLLRAEKEARITLDATIASALRFNFD